MSSELQATAESTLAPEHSEPRNHYLNVAWGVRSWLLTVDHKRIALLYLVSVTVMFALGGIFAGLIRLELLTPESDMVQSDVYNRLFTMHGVIMIICTPISGTDAPYFLAA